MGSSTVYDENDPNAIEVWITTGRDQATIMRQMVDDSFAEVKDDFIAVI